MQQTKRVAVSLPKELISKIEKVRESLHLNRSQYYRFALKNYLEEFQDPEEKNLAKLYQEINKTDQELLYRFRKHSYKNLPPYEE